MAPLSERILDCVERIPVGRVMAYKDVAEWVGSGSGRVVGRVLALEGSSVPWHRVVRADGTCVEHLRSEQLARLRAEGVPITNGRVALDRARWDGH